MREAKLGIGEGREARVEGRGKRKKKKLEAVREVGAEVAQAGHVEKR